MTNFLSVVGCMARIFLMSANGKNELVDLFSSKVAPNKLAHKSIHIHKLAIVACLESHIM